jgi:uncharacterized membrane protein YbhN (UPF0104 family)
MKRKNSINLRLYISVFIGVLALLFIYFQKDTIINSINAIQSASVDNLLIALIVYSCSVFAAAAVIYNLRLINKLNYRKLLLVQTSTLFLGRITPASVGGPAAIARVLYTQGHSVVQSGTVVAAGGLATFVGNVLVAGLALLFSLQAVSFSAIEFPVFILYVMFGLILIFIILLNIKGIRLKLLNIKNDIKKTIYSYKSRKKSIIYAIICGSAVTLAFSLTLMLSARSLGVDISLFAAIITVSLGSLGVAVTPLPGGVVGAEAALAATMVQFGVTADLALGIAFVYRFIIFWLALIPGFIASQYALKKQLL